MKIQLRCFTFCAVIVSSLSLHAQTFSQKSKVVGDFRFEYQYFGFSSSVDGNYAIFGDKWDKWDALGSNEAAAAGSAYIYTKVNDVWEEDQKIVPLDRLTHAANDQMVFGTAVAISGNTAVVSAVGDDYDENSANQIINAGSVYIFERNPLGVWEQKQKVCALDRAQSDYFGNQVAIAGNYLMVASSQNKTDAQGLNSKVGAGAAYLFEKQNDIWVQVAKLVAPVRTANDNFGFSIAIHQSGIAAVGAYGQDTDASELQTLDGAGAAYIFLRDGNGTWAISQKLVSADREPSGRFGMSIDVTADYCAVGADLEAEKDVNDVTQTSCGTVYVFTKNGDQFVQPVKILADDRFTGDSFGRLVRLSGTYLLIAATTQDNLPTDTRITSNSGSLYVFNIDALNNWNQLQQFKHTDPNNGDMFGLNADISGLDIVVGSYFSDYDEQDANYFLDAGAGYFFEGEFPCVPTSSSLQETACFTYTSPSGNYVWTVSDTYTDTIQNAQGCDSVITIELEVITFDNGITLQNNTLQANDAGAEYKWLQVTQTKDIIANEISASFTPQQTGTYAVEITKQGCVDTSESVLVEILPNAITQHKLEYTKRILQDNSIHISFPKTYATIAVQVISISGQVIQTIAYSNTNDIQIPDEYNQPSFILKIKADRESFTVE